MFAIRRPETPEEFQAYFDLRWRLLRAPWEQPRGSEKDEFEDAAHHLVARTEDGALVGIGRIHWNSDGDAQIRYMATHQDHRGQGVGSAMLEQLEEFARESGARRIVLNARLIAVPFYEKHGYAVTGLGPTLFDTIEHRRMQKQL